MQLFLRSLEQEVEQARTPTASASRSWATSRAFDARIVELIRRAEELTADNTRLTLTVAANYGGRWDILQAADRCRAEDPAARRSPRSASRRSCRWRYAPEPDLFIRTGGEQRVSNFLLWQLAYTEFYFTDTLWPDFGAAALDEAFASYRRRERRFGRTSEQLAAGRAAATQAG